jgi:hypothetical protein
MKRLRLQLIENDARIEGRYNLVLDPYLNLEIQHYVDAYKSQFPDKKTPKADELIVAIVRQFLAADADFAKYKRGLKRPTRVAAE